MTTVDRPLKKTKLVSLPSEIIEEILSRLPVKSILQCRSVCKPWLSIISNPSFTKLHFSRATVSHLTGLIISIYDKVSHKQQFLSGAHDGGPLTHLITLDQQRTDCSLITGVTHVNGLVLLTSRAPFYYYKYKYFQAFVINPSTHKISKLPAPDFNTNSTGGYGFSYLFGFDESTNDHKILHIRRKSDTWKLVFMIFSMSSHSWRKIDADPPVGFSWDCLCYSLNDGVCVNNVVHIMLLHMPFDILSFDFSTEKFSLVSIPRGVVQKYEVVNDIGYIKSNRPSITKINGCLGVFDHDQGSSEVHIWLLQDYDNRVWVKETIKFPESWNKLVGDGHLSIDANMDDEIVFSVCEVSENVMTMPVNNWKSKSFKSLQFPLDDQVLRSEFVKFDQNKWFVESIMMPL